MIDINHERSNRESVGLTWYSIDGVRGMNLHRLKSLPNDLDLLAIEAAAEGQMFLLEMSKNARNGKTYFQGPNEILICITNETGKSVGIACLMDDNQSQQFSNAIGYVFLSKKVRRFELDKILVEQMLACAKNRYRSVTFYSANSSINLTDNTIMLNIVDDQKFKQVLKQIS